MTFVVKHRGAGARVALEWRCPEHGRFDLTVERPEPDAVPCPQCGASSPWTPSAPRVRVKAGEAGARGGYQKPEHPGWLDTRALGEGQPLEEWQADRAKMREKQRQQDVWELLHE